MTPRVCLSESEVVAALASLPGWSFTGGRLRRTLVFADFSEAFGFMVRAALEAEKLDHHPDWRNVYKAVEVELWTHDAGGVTALDLQLARRMETLAGG